MKKKILYYSVHEALEYDDIRIFQLADFTVFSLGSYIMPGTKGNRLRGSEGILFSEEDYEAARHGGCYHAEGKRRITRDFARRFDAVVVTHDPNFIIDNIDSLSDTLIIRRTVGQTTVSAERMLERYRSMFKVVRYSPCEAREGYSEPDAIIRFGKFMEDFSAWKSGERFITFMNRASRNLARPSLFDYEKIVNGFPIDLYGLNNADARDWRGTCSPSQQFELLSNCKAYIYIHSLIANYTLNFIEALCAGCPIIAPSAIYVSRENPHPIWMSSMYEIDSIINDGAGFLYDTISEARYHMDNINDQDLMKMSMLAKEKAADLFGSSVIAKKWLDFVAINTR